MRFMNYFVSIDLFSLDTELQDHFTGFSNSYNPSLKLMTWYTINNVFFKHVLKTNSFWHHNGSKIVKKLNVELLIHETGFGYFWHLRIGSRRVAAFRLIWWSAPGNSTWFDSLVHVAVVIKYILIFFHY